ncbi:MAG: phosphatase PAP2-related protein [Bacteroidota bacterium]
MTNPLAARWAEAWHDRRFRLQAIGTAILLVPLFVGLTRFLNTVERRRGVVMDDPVLAWIAAVDLTWPIFTIIYAGVVGGILLMLRNPRRLLMAFQSYGVLALFRMAAMYCTPLDPPPGMIVLKDPFVELFGPGEPFTRDLFFSGHTSTLFLLFLLADGRTLKGMYLLGTIAVAAGVVVQHVHYTVDVLAAPFVAYGSYRLVRSLVGGSA